MRILQVLPTLEAGGAEGFVTNLAVSLAEGGAEVRIFLMAGIRGERGQLLSSRLNDAGVEILGAEARRIRSPGSILRLAKVIRSWQPDVVQANMYQAEILIVLARAFVLGMRTQYLRRLASVRHSGRRSGVLFGCLMRILAQSYPLTVACSPAVADAGRHSIGTMRKHRLVTIPNGGLLQSSPTFPHEKNEARKQLQIPSDSFVVAHIGRMLGGERSDSTLGDGAKGHDILLRAFADAFAGDSRHVLVLVGDGPLRQAAESLARSLGINTQTRFLGQQPEPWSALNAADVFCFPSRYEGLPNVLPEAASCGLPVVASDIPEIRAISRGSAWLLKPVNDVQAFADGLRMMRDELEHFTRCAHDAAKGFSKQYSMSTCARRYMSAYKSLLGQHDEPPEVERIQIAC